MLPLFLVALSLQSEPLSRQSREGPALIDQARIACGISRRYPSPDC